MKALLAFTHRRLTPHDQTLCAKAAGDYLPPFTQPICHAVIHLVSYGPCHKIQYEDGPR